MKSEQTRSERIAQFLIRYLAQVAIILLTVGMAHQVNKESETVRYLFFLKSCEAEVLRKVCLKTCFEELPKIGAHMIKINQAQQNGALTDDAYGD